MGAFSKANLNKGFVTLKASPKNIGLSFDALSPSALGVKCCLALHMETLCPSPKQNRQKVTFISSSLHIGSNGKDTEADIASTNDEIYSTIAVD